MRNLQAKALEKAREGRKCLGIPIKKRAEELFPDFCSLDQEYSGRVINIAFDIAHVLSRCGEGAGQISFESDELENLFTERVFIIAHILLNDNRGINFDPFYVELLEALIYRIIEECRGCVVNGGRDQYVGYIARRASSKLGNMGIDSAATEVLARRMSQLEEIEGKLALLDDAASAKKNERSVLAIAKSFAAFIKDKLGGII